MPAASPLPKRPWYSPMALAQRLMYYYLFFCVALFFLQNWLLFPRWMTGGVLTAAEASRQAGEAGLIAWPHSAASDPAALRGYVSLDFMRSVPRGTIVVFHGNGGWAGQRLYYLDAFTPRGFRVFLYEYPGYGGRPGSPSEASIVPDARALVRSLDQAGLGPVYVWGESVGAGIAASVCSAPTLPVHGLTLLTPWNSLTRTAGVHYPFVPVDLLLTDHYDSVVNLQHFSHPICVVCSSNDRIIPVRLGLDLYEHLPQPKKLIIHQGADHNDWPSSPELTWWDEALNFMALNSVVTRCDLLTGKRSSVITLSCWGERKPRRVNCLTI